MRFFYFLRSLVVSILYPFLIIGVVLLFIFNDKTKKSREFQDKVALAWARISLRLYGVELEIRGAENIPQRGSLFLFNHTSLFDVLSLSASVNGLRFGAKKELYKIPIFSYGLRISGTLPIARENREEVFKVYQEAEARVAKGEKFALAPEGGRSSEEKLKPFKSGPFIFAINCKMPIVPVVIKGAKEVLGKKDLLPNTHQWHSRIVVEFLPLIETAEFKLNDRYQLQEKVFTEMNRHFS